MTKCENCNNEWVTIEVSDLVFYQRYIKKMVNALGLKEIQDLTSQIDQELNRLYKASTLNLTAKSKAIEFLQTLRKIVEKRAKAIFMESLK